MNTDAFLAAALRNPVNDAIADELSRLALPDAWIVSGCLVQTAWNVLTDARSTSASTTTTSSISIPNFLAGRGRGDPQLQRRLAHLGVKIETRNQARVHLWYPEKHGLPYPPLRCSAEGIDRFLTRNDPGRNPPHADGHEVYAPNGFDDIAGLIVRPNPGPNFSAAGYAAKAARWKSLWPEITVLAADAG